MRIAVVGTGVAGLVAARVLSTQHDVDVFEANDYVGGHTHTHDVEVDGQRHTVDTGFIVFNERAYPNFIALLRTLDVASQATSMSFSVRDDRDRHTNTTGIVGLEYGGETLAGTFAQPSNLLRPRFWRLLRDILRFGREYDELLRSGGDSSGIDESTGLSDYLRARHYSPQFIEQYARPIGASIWSAAPEMMNKFPARHFVRFFNHHGVLDVRTAPQWRFITGGSRSYVSKLIAPFKNRIRLSTKVQHLTRYPDHVKLRLADGSEVPFDHAVLATHSDQALALLSAPTQAEREILGAIAYQPNDVTLHTDTSLMPRSRRAWSSWNYLVPAAPQARVAVTYWMNLLQAIPSSTPLFVSLNCQERIDPVKTIKLLHYHHPVYTAQTLAAQARHNEISGANRVHYCGAYWKHGFHEDGVDSALAVTRYFDLDLSAVTMARA